MAQSYDVAVIGAGPAGSSAARVIAQSGLSTIVFERRKTVGVPVQCGELIPTPYEIKTLFPHSGRLPRLVNIPKDIITNQTSKIRLISPRGRKFTFPFQMNVVNRARFDLYLAQEAINAGADLELSSTLIQRTRSNDLSVMSKDGLLDFKASIIVGADGPRSVVSKSMGNNYRFPQRDLSPSLNYLMSGVNCEPDVVEMYFSNTIAPGGYCWIIPKGKGFANVGFGIRRSFAAPHISLSNYLGQFIRHHPTASRIMSQAKIESRIGAIIPVGGPVEITNSLNAVLVGDAAGHVMASNGGGIPTALCGGEIAGKAIVKHFENGESLDLYTDMWKKEFGQELESALSVLRVADQVMFSDRITEICMSLAGARFLEPLIRCRLPIPIDLASKTLVRVLKQIV